MLSNQEGPIAASDPEEEIGRAEVAVGDPKILRLRPSPRSDPTATFLGMTVFAQDHIGGQHQPGVEHDQRMTGQGRGADGPQFLDPMLGPGEVVAVEDPGAITGQAGRPGALHGIDDRGQPRGHRVDQRGRHDRSRCRRVCRRRRRSWLRPSQPVPERRHGSRAGCGKRPCPSRSTTVEKRSLLVNCL